MFEIEMLPAREGDALWIRYGDPASPHQVLIDGGRAGTYNEIKARFSQLPEDQREFELFVITHVDRDHIEGALKLLEDPNLSLAFKEIWFNGYDHLQGTELETYGAVQGERLTTAILRRKAVWNKAFGGGPIKVANNGDLPVRTLVGGLKLTILSPDADKLEKLLPKWKKECADAGLQPGIEARITEAAGLEPLGTRPNVERLAANPLAADKTLPNGSSIALLAEYDGIRVLLGADAHLDRLTASVGQLAEAEGGTLALDAFKLPHHGSAGNVSQGLLERIACPRYLISSNGDYFSHPADEAIARLLKFGGPSKTLYFNYASDFTKPWRDDVLQAEYDYEVEFPTDNDDGIDGTLVVSLTGPSA